MTVQSLWSQNKQKKLNFSTLQGIEVLDIAAKIILDNYCPTLFTFHTFITE